MGGVAEVGGRKSDDNFFHERSGQSVFGILHLSEILQQNSLGKMPLPPDTSIPYEERHLYVGLGVNLELRGNFICA